MLKNFFHILIIYILLVSNLYSEIIEKIDVAGNKRISKNSIITFSELKAGSTYNNDMLNKSLKNLYETNFFKDIKFTFDQNTLFISVEENPIIEEINITGIKKKSFQEFIKENIYLKERISFNDFYLKKDIDLIQNILNNSGYYFSTIQTNFSINEDLNSVKLNIDIDLGSKAKIKNISFLGDKVFKDKKLLQIIATEEHKFWKFISSKVFLNKNLIDLDKRLLENYYKNQGYYNVKIADNFAELDKNSSSFKLIYIIDSGKKFIFNNFSLSLPEDYTEKDFYNIYKTFKKNVKRNYSQNILNDILNEIDRIASNRLYDFIDVTLEEEIVDENKINLNFTVNDSKRFYVERVNIFGNYQTYEEVVRNQLAIDEGDPLNNLLYEKSLNNIRSLGIFKNVESKIIDGKNDNYKIVEISVEEQPTGEVSLAAGFGTDGFTTGGSINEKNFAGKAINLNSFIEISEDSLKGEIIYSKPNFAYTDNTLFTSIRSINRDFLSIYGYESKEIGSSIGTKFEQFENLFFSPAIELTLEELSTNSTASSNIKKQEGNYKDFYFNYNLDYDLRDVAINTKEGFITSFNQKIPMVSENNELSNEFFFTKYKELNKSSEMIGKASFYTKIINTIDGSDVRISKRAIVPYNRLRGFEKGKVGPIDNNDYIGGNYVSTMNLSSNIPGILPTVENIDFNFFFDIANVWGVDYNSSLDNSTIRSSTGLGINILTPVGPLSFSYAQPITKASTDKTESFRFNLGTTF